MAEGENLTNLGVLWIGRRTDRAKLLYAPVIQFIKYDDNGKEIKVSILRKQINKLIKDNLAKPNGSMKFRTYSLFSQ
jgi:hypothetical protein